MLLGATVNRTELFKSRRTEQRMLERQMIEKKIGYLQWNRKQSASSFSLFSSFCRSCGCSLGIFQQAKTCAKCQHIHCTKCTITYVGNEDFLIHEFLAPNEYAGDFILCDLCSQLFKQFCWYSYPQYLRKCLEEAKQLITAYTQLAQIKDEIEKLFPHFQHLVTSLPETPSQDTESLVNIITDAKLLQNRLSERIVNFQLLAKSVISASATSYNGTAFCKNIMADLARYEQARISSFKRLQRQLYKHELYVLTQAYVMYMQTMVEMQQLGDVNFVCQRLLETASTTIMNDIWKTCIKAHVDWSSYKSEVFQQAKRESSPTKKFVSVGTQVRKASNAIKTILNKIDGKGFEFVASIVALKQLGDHLDEWYAVGSRF